MSSQDDGQSGSDPYEGSEYDVCFDGAERGPVTPHRDGGWPTFTITLTYHVDGTDDMVKAQQSARAFFEKAEWPEGVRKLP